MKTVKISALVLAMAGVFATSANAQTAKTNAWEGAYAQVKAGYASFSPSVGTLNTSFSGNPAIAVPPLTGIANPSANNLNTATAAIDAGYNFGIDSKYTLGLGLTYYTGATGSGNATLSPVTAGRAGPPVNLNYQLKNLWAVTLQPGFAVDKDRLVYAKVGYTGVTIGASGSAAPNTLGVGGSGSSIAYQTVNLSGYSLGLGYKQIFSGSWYWMAEANYGSFSNKTATINVQNRTAGNGTATGNFGGAGMDFLVGVGYRF